jgi:hypothetical protein
MTLLRTPEATPNRLIGAWRYLAGSTEDTKLEVLAKQALMPESQLPDRSSDPRGAVQKNLDVGVEIGLFTRDDARVGIAPDIDVAPENGNPDALRFILERLLLSGERADSGFARSIAWFLTQDPRDAPWTSDSLPHAIDKSGWKDETGLTSDTRFTVFRVWAQYLGFASVYELDGKSVITPDPTNCIARHIPQIVEEKNVRVSLHQFVDSLSIRCPVFDGGTYRDEAESLLNDERRERHLSESTSLALHRLADRGDIDLVYEADDPTHMILQSGGRAARCSHLVRK